jgi:diguanylate cyclase (GGDEF)-like protein
MSLIRQIWLLLGVTVLLALAGSVTIGTLSSRETLQTQLRLKNADNAQSLALALSQHTDDQQVMEMLLAAQFDTGFYRRITFTPADGSVGFQRQSEVRPTRAPGWFRSIVPIESIPGVAQVSDGWKALGAVEVVSHAAFAYDDLWRVTLRSAVLLALVGLAAGAIATIAVRGIRRPLEATVAQANALVEGRFVRVMEPAVPELQRVAQAMNSMVERLKTLFEAQSTQVEQLRKQAHNDPLTGLPNRRQFLGQLTSAMHREDAPAEGGLVLLRVRDLAGLNTSLGHDTTDRALQAIAQVLGAYPGRGEGCILGRLNGSDFALVLPVRGVAAETAHSLAQALRVALPAFGPRISVAFGAVEMRHGAELSPLLAAADAALARAENEEPFSVATGELAGGPEQPRGERTWRQQILDALAHGRSRLVEFAVLDRKGRLLALECPLRLQLEDDGPLEPAGRWLPLAIRNKLTPAVDEHALKLALAGIAADGRARCVNLSPASLADSSFAARLRGVIGADPPSAHLLWLEIAESAAVEHFEWVQEIGRQLRPLGVRLGLEHAGSRLGQIERLYEAGLDYVKLDVSVIGGVASDANRASHVAGIVAMLHGLSLQVIAEGVTDLLDVTALWDCGVDGVTGPWATAQAEQAASVAAS